MQKKNKRYVHTHEQMSKELVELGLSDTQLHLEDGTIFQGDNLRTLVDLMTELAEPLETLERRGIDLRLLARSYVGTDGLLPRYRVFHGRQQHWFAGKDELDKFLAETSQTLGQELSISEDHAGDSSTGVVPENSVQVIDLHEVRMINKVLQQLIGYGIKLKDLTPAGQKNGMQLYPFKLVSDGDTVPLTGLGHLLTNLRKLGERGLKLTRFKGLGEMDSEELWETAMDPEKRTLLQVGMNDAVAADEIFRVLMGDHVEPRREFIEKHALDVKDLDV